MFPVRLAFSGLMRAGKTTAADYVAERFGATKFSWADPVKLQVYDFLECNVISNNYTRPYKAEEKYPFPRAHFPLPSLIPKSELEQIEWINANKKWLRPLLQWWGADYRRNQDPDYWLEKAKLYVDFHRSNIVNDDSRYENEGEFLRKKGFHIVQINRPGTIATSHSSEQLQIKPDYNIENNSDLKWLHYQIELIVLETTDQKTDFARGKIPCKI